MGTGSRDRVLAAAVRLVDLGFSGRDPLVIRHYENGRTIAAVLGDLGRDSDFGDLPTRGAPKAPS
jgi:hypothetical protein